MTDRRAKLSVSPPSRAAELRALWGDDDVRFHRQRGIGPRVGFGRRPAVLVVDMSRAYCDPNWRGGADQGRAISAINGVLTSARRASVPVVFLTMAFGSGDDAGNAWVQKDPALLELRLGDAATQIDPRLDPKQGEPVVVKHHPSAFFQTAVDELLRRAGVDTVILTGCSTSGCIRASASDAVSLGYRLIVPIGCVSDRVEGPHWASLFDIDTKYGDVMDDSDVIDYLERLPVEVEAK